MNHPIPSFRPTTPRKHHSHGDEGHEAKALSQISPEPALIGIDWGTTSLRAYLIGAGGEVLDKVASSRGITSVPDRAFDSVLNQLIACWSTYGGLPVLASGMITSRNGWVETPYSRLPLGTVGLAQSLVPHHTESRMNIHFITGAVIDHASGADVMRGEETQIIGAQAFGMSDGIFVMPGTHSKWVRVSAGRIEDFATYMTGEVFAALKGHTILGTLIGDGPFDPEGFAQGVSCGLARESYLLHDLFRVRTLPLLGRMAGNAVADFLSGMLIGAEVKAAQIRGDTNETITIVGRCDLADRYETALKIAGKTSQRLSEDTVAHGHYLIARAAEIVNV
ncbi:2-keto-3-deoxygalactonate kinase [Aliiruegeria haliotis]|uniref:2-keto-3-deoxygalactonate kinase n=1 Tax=Aliiruegeria haliotis TaxID=1280846 RepID=A0A2T0RGW1_9RHOB|nr:2-dehydro-3-deoxygalactonokinase [Aliiruegeria haliotis]PRY20405.1 2-keto-3-deoxygalactonate kinase [Aliiruegeria haliotis]